MCNSAGFCWRLVTWLKKYHKKCSCQGNICCYSPILLQCRYFLYYYQHLNLTGYFVSLILDINFVLPRYDATLLPESQTRELTQI